MRFHTLFARSILWIVLPVSVVMATMLVFSWFAYQKLVIQDPWSSLTAQNRIFLLIMTFAGITATLTVAILSWIGVRRIIAPLQLLVDQISRLAADKPVEPLPSSGIAEIDTLEAAFDKLAHQINSYHVGLSRYVGRITSAQEEERRRIARELHDETVQSLLAISRQLDLHQSMEDDQVRRDQLADLQNQIKSAVHGIRQISQDLRPLVLEDLGLIPALKTLVQAMRTGQGAIPHASFEVSGNSIQLDPEQELTLYRIVQEALTNVRKHAGATGVLVQLEFNPEEVRLNIADDGAGFQLPLSFIELAQNGNFGLLGIQERVWSMNGTLDVRSSPGEGTQLKITLPLSEGKAHQLPRN